MLKNGKNFAKTTVAKVKSAACQAAAMAKRPRQNILIPLHRARLRGDDSVLNMADMTDHQQTVTAPKLRHQPPFGRFWESMAAVSRRKTSVIAVFAALAILVHLVLRSALRTSPGAYQIPLLATLALGGIPLVYGLLTNLLRREFGSDLLAGISIVTSVVLGEYLAGSIVVLMLSGGEALENYALRSASSVLRALAKQIRCPQSRIEKEILQSAMWLWMTSQWATLSLFIRTTSVRSTER